MALAFALGLGMLAIAGRLAYRNARDRAIKKKLGNIFGLDDE